MTQTEILNSDLTKSEKMRKLFELGLSRREVAELMGVGYGFAQNVFAAAYPERILSRRGFNFVFNRNFGVEIEAFGADRDYLESRLNEAGIETRSERYNHETRSHWKLISDASLCGVNSFELVSPILKGEEGLEQLKIVSRVLKEANVKINKTCGLHIHLEVKDYKINAWKNLYSNYAFLEPTIDTFLPQSRRGNNNQFCKSMRVDNYEAKLNNSETLQDLERNTTRRDRYYKMNIQSFWKYKTVEFRGHSGTIDYGKISNWILI
jgi:hypothetical protein